MVISHHYCLTCVTEAVICGFKNFKNEKFDTPICTICEVIECTCACISNDWIYVKCVDYKMYLS